MAMTEICAARVRERVMGTGPEKEESRRMGTWGDPFVGRSGNPFELPLAVRTERVHAVEARHATSSRVRLVALDVHAQLDGLGHERARRRVNDLLDELTEPSEHGARVVGVDGGDAARVARV